MDVEEAPKGSDSKEGRRRLVFISKATPQDDDFALWLAPRLEAAGYEVFSDILCLKYGDRWRKVLTDTLYDSACKMLLCCKSSTLAKAGVLEEIEIAGRLAGELNDRRFMLPLRLEKNFRAPFGTAGLQYVDFVDSWADGLTGVLEYLEEEQVPRRKISQVNPEWERYQSRRSLSVENEPEALVSNWLRIAEVPDKIRYFSPKGAISIGAVTARCKKASHPIQYHNRGIITFLNPLEVSEWFEGTSEFELICETSPVEFEEYGMPEIRLEGKDAHNILASILQKSWNSYCRCKGFDEYAYSSQLGFHASEELIGIGKKVPWGGQGDRRSAMLRNIAKGKVWNFGVTATPVFWPYPHFRLKTRVLFSEVVGDKLAGGVIEKVDQQFRLRRSICKGWRNKQWYGRLMAFLEILAGDSAFIKLEVSPSVQVKIVADTIRFVSPVTTSLPDRLDDTQEDDDENLLTSNGFYEDLEADIGAS